MIKHRPCSKCGTLNRHVVERRTKHGNMYEVRCATCKSPSDPNMLSLSREAAWERWDAVQTTGVPIVASTTPTEELLEFATSEVVRVSNWLNRVPLEWDRGPGGANERVIAEYQRYYHQQEMMRSILVDWISMRI